LREALDLYEAKGNVVAAMALRARLADLAPEVAPAELVPEVSS
jgi:hypothetical protein